MEKVSLTYQSKMVEEHTNKLLKWKKQWLHDRQFIGFWVLFIILQINCNRLNQTNWIRKPWIKATN